MTDFKAGDKVTLVENSDLAYLSLGTEYEILRIEGDFVCLKCDDLLRRWYNSSNFKLVEEPKIKESEWYPFCVHDEFEKGWYDDDQKVTIMDIYGNKTTGVISDFKGVPTIVAYSIWEEIEETPREWDVVETSYGIVSTNDPTEASRNGRKVFKVREVK